MPHNHLASSTAACCWIPLFALRCEEARRPELASQPCALLAPDTTRRIWQVSPLAHRAGVKPGMTVSQAIGLCSSLRLCEPDPVHYDEQFARLLAALSEVSPVVEPAELGRAYVGTDGLEKLYGSPQQIVEIIQMRSAECGMRNFSEGSFATRDSHLHSAFRIPHSALRVGWGREAPEPIVAALAFFSPVVDRAMLAHALDRLIERALQHPRRIGWRVQVVRVRAELEHGASWMIAATLKDPTADRDRIAAPLRTRLEQAPPAGAVERLAVEFTAFAPGTAELQLFARDANAAARAGRRRALRTALQEIRLRLKRTL